jgi:glycosyltransferase involved in cell wall biosynthesis
MPIALIEAQLAGIPVVATDVGSNSEVVLDGVTGLITAVDPTLFVEAIHSFLGDPDLIREMGRAAKIHALDKLGLSENISKHSTAYFELLNRNLSK